VTESREVVRDARDIARGLDSATLEAEHLLLAVAGRPGTAAGRILAEAGLDEDGVRNALAAEFEDSLRAAGIALGDFDLSVAAPPLRTPRWGASAKLALQRSARVADARRDRRITPGHIVAGVLRASVGTVPRALACVGVDRVELGGRVESAL
jgi:ATP-dependent Clp protease ATP-binding subunit ClpA